MSTSPQGRISASCSLMLKKNLGMIIRITIFNVYKSARPHLCIMFINVKKNLGMIIRISIFNVYKSARPQDRIMFIYVEKKDLGMIIRIDLFNVYKSASPHPASCSSMLKKKPWYDYKD